LEKKEKITEFVITLKRFSDIKTRQNAMHCRDYHRLLFLDSFFESLVDDVMRMTHQKFLSEHKLHIQKFMIQKRENRFAPIRSFCGHFTKSSDFCQNLIMPMLSLILQFFENCVGKKNQNFIF